MGLNIIESIIEEREKFGHFKDIQDFIKRTYKYGLNKRVIESMILSGAFDCFNVKRSQMMNVYEKLLEQASTLNKREATGQFSLFDTLLKDEETLNKVDYPNIEEFDEQTKLKYEKDIVGVYVSGHPLDKYFDKFSAYTFNSSFITTKEDGDNEVGEVEVRKEQGLDNSIEDGEVVKFGGIITSIKKIYTKRDNKEMAVIGIEDLYGSLEIMAFPNSYFKYKNIITIDKIVEITGKVNIRDEQNPIILLENLVALDEEKEEVKENTNEQVLNIKEQKLYLRFDCTNEELQKEVFNILESYIGTTKVTIRCSKTNNLYQIATTVNPTNALIYELYNSLGDNNVVLK